MTWQDTKKPWVELVEDGQLHKESDLNANVVKYIKTLPRSFAKKRRAGPGQRGQPDVTGCIDGRRIEIEGKIWPNKPTDKQSQWLDRWERAGAVAFVYFSLEDMKVKLERFVREYNRGRG